MDIKFTPHEFITLLILFLSPYLGQIMYQSTSIFKESSKINTIPVYILIMFHRCGIFKIGCFTQLKKGFSILCCRNLIMISIFYLFK